MSNLIKVKDNNGNELMIDSSSLKDAIQEIASGNDNGLLLPDNVTIRTCNVCELHEQIYNDIFKEKPKIKKEPRISGWSLFRKHLIETDEDFHNQTGSVIMKKASVLWNDDEVKNKWNKEAIRVNKEKNDLKTMENISSESVDEEEKKENQCVRCNMHRKVYLSVFGNKKNKRKTPSISGWSLYRRHLASNDESYKDLPGKDIMMKAAESWKDPEIKSIWNQKALMLNKETSKDIVISKD